MSQIFISHSRADADIKSFFERIFAVTKVRAVFVEYEDYTPPPGPFIQAQINQSAATFILLGPHVEQLQHTKVWVASETGISQQAQKHIWVFDPANRPCNIPVPFVTHYIPYVQSDDSFQYIKAIVNSYDDSAALEAIVRGTAIGAAGGAMLADESERKNGAVVGAIFGAAIESIRSNPARFRPMGTQLSCGYPDCRALYGVHGTPPSYLCPVCRRPLDMDWGKLQLPQSA